MSTGRTSTVPMAPARPASSSIRSPLMKLKPAFTAYLRTVRTPVRSRARMAGMFSEYWSASRTSTGPRSIESASLGAHPAPNGVVMSSRTVPAVRAPVSKPVAYTMGFQAEPGWRRPWPAWSYFESNLGEALR